MSTLAPAAPLPECKPIYRILYVQVLVAIGLGTLVGLLFPHVASSDWMKALGDAFIRLIRMAIAPIIFCTVVSGIAHLDDARKVGRIGVKALVYFELVSTLALAIGLLIGNIFQPGAGFPGSGDAAKIAKYTQEGPVNPVDFLLHIIPNTVVDAFAKGDILQVLTFSILFGFALLALGERSARLRLGLHGGRIWRRGLAQFTLTYRDLLRHGGAVCNGVACVVVSRWENQLDAAQMRVALAHPNAAGDIPVAAAIGLSGILWTGL